MQLSRIVQNSQIQKVIQWSRYLDAEQNSLMVKTARGSTAFLHNYVREKVTIEIAPPLTIGLALVKSGLVHHLNSVEKDGGCWFVVREAAYLLRPYDWDAQADLIITQLCDAIEMVDVTVPKLLAHFEFGSFKPNEGTGDVLDNAA